MTHSVYQEGKSVANKTAKGFEGSDLQEEAVSVKDAVKSFAEDAKEDMSELTREGMKAAKSEIKKDIRKARSFAKEHPAQTAAYALGIGAVLSYFLMPRKKY